MSTTSSIYFVDHTAAERVLVAVSENGKTCASSHHHQQIQSSSIFETRGSRDTSVFRTTCQYIPVLVLLYRTAVVLVAHSAASREL